MPDGVEILVYDLEIVKGIRPKHGQVPEGIEYAKDWYDFKGMGISVIGLYSYKHDKYSVFEYTNIAQIQEPINEHKLLVGFNNISFDNKLLRAFGVTVPGERVYDIYVEVKKAAGAATFAKGYKLQDIALANGLEGKTGSGENAPILWQRGYKKEVKDYCLQDIRMTKMLLDLINVDKLVDPKSGNLLKVQKPFEYEEIFNG